jgi:hypothetical protein
MIGQARIKQPESGPVTLTASGAGSTITSTPTAYAIGTNKAFNAVRAIFPFIKTGGGGAVAVQLELQSDSGTSNAYQSVSLPSYVAGTANAPTITPVGTDAAHGYVATTGPGVVEAMWDLDNVKVNANLKIKISATFVAASVDAVVGTPLLEFFNAREEPPTSTTEATSA